MFTLNTAVYFAALFTYVEKLQFSATNTTCLYREEVQQCGTSMRKGRKWRNKNWWSLCWNKNGEEWEGGGGSSFPSITSMWTLIPRNQKEWRDGNKVSKHLSTMTKFTPLCTKKKKHPRKGTIKIQQLQQQQDSNICTVSSRWRAEYMTRIHWEKAVTLAPSHVM